MIDGRTDDNNSRVLTWKTMELQKKKELTTEISVLSIQRKPEHDVVLEFEGEVIGFPGTFQNVQALVRFA
jgi:hypothetical protein